MNASSPPPSLVARAIAWMGKDPDRRTVAEVQDLLARGDATALAARFAGRLRFGTAGLRAEVGAGPLRMNRLVVRETAAGLLNALAAAAPGAADGGVVVGYDGRLDSRRFAEDIAAVIAARGVPVWWVGQPTPTPAVGFAVRHLGAGLGVVVTASHNPPAYNGVKVYWHDGVQLVPPFDQQVAAAIEQVAAAATAPPAGDLAALAADGTLRPLPEAVLAAYLAAIAARPPPPPAPGSLRPDRVLVAYTPLHGVGAPWVQPALAAAGFTNVATVAEQERPDGHFPTVASPNPEDPAALARVIALARARGAALALANDPDADRLAVGLPAPGQPPTGAWRVLTGDEIGTLLAAYLLPAAPPDSVVATTVVSSDRLAAMARAHNVAFFCSLTGFKWLAMGMRQAKQRGLRPLLAYEEALGFALGDAVWDKDGVAAALMVTRMIAAWQAQGSSAWAQLAAIEARYGRLRTAQHVLPISASARRAASASAPARLGPHPVVGARDLQRQPLANPWTAAPYPPAEVSILTLTDARRPARSYRVIVRPSGTEPTLKCYYQLNDPPDLHPDAAGGSPPRAEGGPAGASTAADDADACLRKLMAYHAEYLACIGD